MSASEGPITVLLIDDNPDDRALVAHALRAEFPRLVVEQVVAADGFEAALERGQFDVVITDFALRWSDGLAVLAAIRARRPTVPVIMFTGTGTQEIAVEAMKAGLTDYVVKSPHHFGRLPMTVRWALDRVRQAAALDAAEARLRHTQKLEALGQLTAIIAHDFNNALTSIHGYADLLQGEVPPGSQAAQDVQAIIAAAGGATTLANQLLSFGRRQETNPALVDVRLQIEALAPMLRRLMGPRTELLVTGEPRSHIVRVDRGQLDQVLMNLTINARDAMPDGGRVEIDLAEVVGRPADAEGPDTSSERFVRVTVRDTGVGMDDFTRRHAFEPFFTTKPAGLGTGLGLASVYGIVTGAGGVVRLTSSPGQGTWVELLWPMQPADEA